MEVKFAYWVPNVSGGLVVTKLPMRTDWSFDYNERLAHAAEEAGFEYALAQARFFASYGANKQLEAVTTAIALATVTRRLRLIAAVHPGLWHPGVVAKIVASADYISGGRMNVNIVSGWFKDEFIGYGEPWLEHDERYRRSEEFIRVLKGMWTEPEFTFHGDFYRINRAPLEPKPVQYPHPQVFQGGNSHAAREMAARVSDWYFMNGNSVEGVRAQIEDVLQRAARYGRERDIRFAVNAFVICRDSEEEARQVLRDIIEHADVEAVRAFGESVKQAGQASPEREGMWANSTFEDLVQYNDGFKTGLIGTPEQIARRIQELEAVGVDLVLCGFLHFIEEVERFGQEVVPRVRALPSLRAPDWRERAIAAAAPSRQRAASA
ncbi:MAG TPA: dimethyl sulfone monooxygenase SfnG [Bacillota bacterium]